MFWSIGEMAGLQTLMPGVAAECLRSQGWGKAWRLTKKWQSLETRDRRLRGERNIPGVGWGTGCSAPGELGAGTCLRDLQAWIEGVPVTSDQALLRARAFP